MTIFANNQQLTEVELDHLGQFLKNCKGGKAMNIEELDGFFSALIAGPEIVMPSEYMPEVLGSDTPETHQFENLEEADEILGALDAPLERYRRDAFQGRNLFTASAQGREWLGAWQQLGARIHAGNIPAT